MLRTLVGRLVRLVLERWVATDNGPFRRRDITAPDGTVYLERYYVHGWTPWDQRSAPFGVAFHRFLQSDADRDLHNHPWGESLSIVLAGGYLEEYRDGDAIRERTLRPGDTNTIRADHFHRVDLLERDCWTLFIMGPRMQSWGFISRDGGTFTNWRDYLAQRDG